jgi:hypothetical protein
MLQIKLLKPLLALVPASLLWFGAVLSFARRRGGYRVLQLLGATLLLIVVGAHVCEAFGVFPDMGWGMENSAGHYLDLGAAGAGVTLFCLGYFLDGFKARKRYGTEWWS